MNIQEPHLDIQTPHLDIQTPHLNHQKSTSLSERLACISKCLVWILNQSAKILLISLKNSKFTCRNYLNNIRFSNCVRYRKNYLPGFPQTEIQILNKAHENCQLADAFDVIVLETVKTVFKIKRSDSQRD